MIKFQLRWLSFVKVNMDKIQPCQTKIFTLIATSFSSRAASRARTTLLKTPAPAINNNGWSGFFPPIINKVGPLLNRQLSIWYLIAQTANLTCKSVNVVAFVKDLSNAHAIITFGVVKIVVQKIHIHTRLTIGGNGGALMMRRGLEYDPYHWGEKGRDK